MDCTLKLESVIILLYWRDIPSLKLEPKHKHLTFVMRSHESLQIVASESSLKQGQCLSYVHSIFIDCHVMTSHVKGIFIAKLAYCRAMCIFKWISSSSCIKWRGTLITHWHKHNLSQPQITVDTPFLSHHGRKSLVILMSCQLAGHATSLSIWTYVWSSYLSTGHDEWWHISCWHGSYTAHLSVAALANCKHSFMSIPFTWHSAHYREW